MTYHPELLARPVPRYTSYPTAADFTETVGARDMADALATVDDEPVSLYVHIPFCREICAYCGCNTGRANREARLQSYVDALYAEIDLVARALDGRGRVERIAFGGGSPNALSPATFVRLVEHLLLSFNISAPLISLELDPRHLDADWYSAIRAIGVARASLGVQSFAPHIQSAIRRIQPDRMIAKAVSGLRVAGVTSINFDLMYGLPGQTERDLSDSILRSVELGAHRIALFGYAHMPSLLPRQRVIDASALPDVAERFEQAALGRALLLRHGYQPVGFDHFALTGDPLAEAAATGRLNRNFQGFTDDASSTLIGLGASAISQFEGAIIQNEKRAGPYRMRVSAGLLPAQRGILLTASMKERGAIIKALLCHGEAEVDPARMAGEMAALSPFIEQGLVSLSGRHLRLSEDGWPYARAIAAVFDCFRPVTAGQFSHAV